MENPEQVKSMQDIGDQNDWLNYLTYCIENPDDGDLDILRNCTNEWLQSAEETEAQENLINAVEDHM